MYDKNRFYDSDTDFLIAWTGSLKPHELADYLHEPGGCGDNEPQSMFARDLGRAYDHDLIYAQAADEVSSIEQLAQLNYITDSQLVEELESNTADENVNCFIVLWHAKRTDPRDREFAGGRLRCIGSWQHPSPFGDM